MLAQILDILKYILPSVVVLIATVVIVNKFLINETERKRLAIFAENADSSMKLRLQAYERLTIFIERMNTKNLISRFYNSAATAQDVQLAMVQSIRAEFEHNLSQQIYVSHELWQTIKAVMEQEITMLNRVGSSCELGTPASVFVTKLSEYLVNTESTIPTDIALETINKEAKFILFNK